MMLEIIRRATPVGQVQSVSTRTTLQDGLRKQGGWIDLKGQLWQLLRPDVDLTEERWNEAARNLLILLGPYLVEATNPEVQAFLKWSPAIQPIAKGPNTTTATAENVFVHQTATDALRVRFDSIHAVKGETHAATLVVETFNRTHDIKSLVPVICGNKPATALTGSEISHCKRVFVGMTRPSDLICLAIFAAHVTDKDIAQLEQAGWRVEILS